VEFERTHDVRERYYVEQASGLLRSRMIQRLIAAAAMAALVAATLLSLRLAWSDILESRGDLASLRKSIQLTPLNARALVSEAVMIAARDPAGDQAETPLRAALALDPRNAAAWMDLGVKAEFRGDMAQAEKLLLEAARVDRTFKPAWTLANFYVRTGQTERFWRWIRACLEIVEPKNMESNTFDTQPMFDLCWNVTEDANLILERAIPRRHFVLVRYAAYLLEAGRYDAASQVAALSFPLATARDLEFFLFFCDSLINAGRTQQAVDAWNGLSKAKLIALAPLDPANGLSLTNGEMKSEPLNRGFDWRTGRVGGVFQAYVRSPPAMRFDLDGEEDEHIEILAQPVPVTAGARYRVEFQYQTLDIVSRSGLHWNVFDVSNRRQVYGAPSFDARDEEGAGGFEFDAPRDTSLVWLALRFDRLPGTTRPKGWLKLFHMEMKLVR
jgi:tetratricopeptide (TPR) repeat protein